MSRHRKARRVTSWGIYSDVQKNQAGRLLLDLITTGRQRKFDCLTQIVAALCLDHASRPNDEKPGMTPGQLSVSTGRNMSTIHTNLGKLASRELVRRRSGGGGANGDIYRLIFPDNTSFHKQGSESARASTEGARTCARRPPSRGPEVRALASINAEATNIDVRVRALQQCSNAVQSASAISNAALPHPENPQSEDGDFLRELCDAGAPEVHPLEAERRKCAEILLRQRRPATDRHGRPQLDRFSRLAVLSMLDHPHCSLRRLQIIEQRADYRAGTKGDGAFKKDRLAYFRMMLKKTSVQPLQDQEVFDARNGPEHIAEDAAANAIEEAGRRVDELARAFAFNRSLDEAHRRNLVERVLDGLPADARERHEGKYFQPPHLIEDEAVLDLWYAHLRQEQSV